MIPVVPIPTEALEMVSQMISHIMAKVRKDESEREKVLERLRKVAEHVVEDLELPKIYVEIVLNELFDLYERMVAVFTGKAEFEEATKLFLKASFLFDPEGWLTFSIFHLANKSKITLPDRWDLYGLRFSEILLKKILGRKIFEEGSDREVYYNEALLQAFLSASGIPRVFDVNGMPFNIDEPLVFAMVLIYKVVMTLKKRKSVIYRLLSVLKRRKRGINLKEVEFWLKVGCAQLDLIKELMSKGWPTPKKEPKDLEEYISPIWPTVYLSALKNLFEDVIDVAEEYGLAESVGKYCEQRKEDIEEYFRESRQSEG